MDRTLPLWTRRQLLHRSGGAALTLGTMGLAGGLLAPATAQANARFRLDPAPAAVNLVGAKWPATDVWAYDGGGGGTVPGPLIRAKQGARITIDVTNGLPQPTTVHWHGLRVPNGMDGVPGGPPQPRVD